MLSFFAATDPASGIFDFLFTQGILGVVCVGLIIVVVYQQKKLDKKDDKIEALQNWQTMTPTSGSVTTTLGYYKDSLGIVHLRGQLNLSGTGVDFFTLPAGYRPEQYKEYATTAAGAFAVVSVSSTGVIRKILGGNGNLDLDVISFRAA